MAKPKKAKVTGDVAVVTWNGGVREFSKEVHGADFLDLANKFAEKFKGTVESGEAEKTEE